MKYRHCFKCGVGMRSSSFMAINNENSEYLKRIWESPYIELLCCGCMYSFVSKEDE